MQERLTRPSHEHLTAILMPIVGLMCLWPEAKAYNTMRKKKSNRPSHEPFDRNNY